MAHSLEAAVVVPVCLSLICGAIGLVPRFLLAERKEGLETSICAQKSSFPPHLYKRSHLSESGILQGRPTPCLETNPQKILEALRIVNDLSRLDQEETKEPPVLRPQLPGAPDTPVLPSGPDWPSLPWAPETPLLPDFQETPRLPTLPEFPLLPQAEDGV